LLASQTTPLALSHHQWVVSWNIANIWRRDFSTVDGTQHYALPVGRSTWAQMAWPSFVFPLLALMCVPGAFWLARARRWATLALAERLATAALAVSIGHPLRKFALCPARAARG